MRARLYWLKPMVSVARASVSSQANPAEPGVLLNIPDRARCTDSSVHMPSAEPCSAARLSGRS